MKTTLIITTYNAPTLLNLCLRSVTRQTVQPDQIIIADDGSTVETSKLINKWRNKFKCPVNHVWQEDKGFRLSEIRNKAITSSIGDYIIFVDQDIILHKYFIQDHIYISEPGCFVCGHRIKTKKNILLLIKWGLVKQIHWYTPFIKNRDLAIRSKYLESKKDAFQESSFTFGANLAAWKKDFIKVNGFDQIYEGWGFEDLDIVERFKNAGLKRKNYKRLAIAFHIYHNENDRTNEPTNKFIYLLRKEAKAIKAKKGIINCENENQ